MSRLFSFFIIASVLFSPFIVVKAQTSIDLPVYIVQAGDTLGVIAQRFGISLDDLMRANGITNPNLLSLGARLVIPGLNGVRGVLLTQPVPVGETLQTISIRNQISYALLKKLNRITSPGEIFAGVNLVLTESAQNSGLTGQATLQAGQSLLEAAILQNTSTWHLISNHLVEYSTDFFPQDMLFIKSTNSKGEISSISPFIKKISISPLPLVQGKTITIRVYTNKPLKLTGSLAGVELHFFDESQNQYVALQGVHALASPGLASFGLTITDPTEARDSFEENLLLKSGYYTNDPPLLVDPKTIEPATTKPEEDQVNQIYKAATLKRLWNGKFVLPVDEPICLQSTFGNRRSYNDSPFNYFHSGVDFGVCKNLNIYAPAPGKVVFAGFLTVRGNATILDHGWEVFSGYWHQSEIKVNVGDTVKAGQLIGLIGKTGRVTGPHLHWEIIANGIQVEPLDWLEKIFPQ